MAIIASNDELLKKDFLTTTNQLPVILLISSVGNPTAVRTITMVMRPAPGTAAAPIDAAVAVMLFRDKIESGINQIAIVHFKIRVAIPVHKVGCRSAGVKRSKILAAIFL